MRDSKNLAIIPARGGSKGIPMKNVKLLGGVPLLQYSVEVAQKSTIFDRILLSTDSNDIADLGRRLGIEVPFLRPTNLAEDSSPMLPAILHALDYYSQIGYHPNNVFLLQPTSPFRKLSTLFTSLKHLEQGNDSVVGLTRVPDGYSPYYLMKINETGYADFFFEEGVNVGRRQDAAVAYHRCGSVFAFTTACLEKYGNIYGSKCVPIVSDDVEGVNIDNMDDWNRAEKIIKSGWKL